MNTTTTTPAETVAALKRYEIAAAEIVVQSATLARWGNSIAGQYVETVHEFKPGDVLTLRDWRPEGMMTTTPDGRDMFIFWHYLEAMTTTDEIRAAWKKNDPVGYEVQKVEIIDNETVRVTYFDPEEETPDEYETEDLNPEEIAGLFDDDCAEIDDEKETIKTWKEG